MQWFGYIWIVILVMAWLIWTIKCVIDFIRDVRSNWKLTYLIEEGASWAVWAVLHILFIFIGSLAYALLINGGVT